MNLLRRLPAAWNALRGRNEKMDSLELLREIYGSDARTWAGKEITTKTALQVSTQLACGRVIAEGLAMLPWKLMQRTERSIVPAFSHPLFDKLATSPNPLQTAFEFQETMGLHLAFCGNAFVWTPTVSRLVDAMYLLEPGWVTVKYKWPDLPTYTVNFGDGRTLTLSSSEVWQIKGPSWTSYMGLEFVKLARQALGLSMAIEEGQARMHGQGVKTSGFLSVEGTLTPEQYTKLEKWIEEKHTGAENTGRPMILDRATKWMTQAMSNVDAQTLEQRRFAVEEVCRFARVLPIMVGHSDKTASYASSEQMFLAHAMYTLGPWCRRVEQSADKRLLTPAERASGLYTNLNEKAMLRMTAKDQAEVLMKYTGAPFMLRNEARALLDMNPVDGFDEPVSPTNMATGNPPPADEPDPPKPRLADDDTE